MTGRLTKSIRLTEGLVFSQSAYWYGQAAAEQAVIVLNNDFKDKNVVSLNQTWATPNLAFPLQNGGISGNFKDMRSCFNVNALRQSAPSNKPSIVGLQFQLLLKEIGITGDNAKIIADSTRDWVNKNNITSGSQGAEDSYYQSLGVPYLTANKLMVDISELRAVRGVGQKTYDAIVPFLCAIPVADQKINVNTVSAKQPEILYALFGQNSQLSIEDFKRLLADRPASGWSSVDNFLSNPLLREFQASDSLKKQLSVSSDFFQLNGLVKFEQRLLAINLLFKINNKKAKIIRYQSGGFK
jgi:general secretion pathway protein K